MAAKQQILVCDDDELDRIAVIRALRNTDYTVLEAVNAEQAYALLQQHSVTCVLLDLRMPEIDGLEALTHIVENTLTKAPIIMLSGLEDVEASLKCLQLGAQDYLQKSDLTQDVLLRSIRYAKERSTLRHQVEIARLEAEAANKAKTEFLASMSHELRTPLNAILGFSRIVLKDAATKLNERELDALDRVQKNGNYLLELINSVLDLSKVEAGKMELNLSDVDLGETVRLAVKNLEPLAAQKNTCLNIVLPPERSVAKVDSTKFQQIVMNLVSNAIKSTQNGNVTVVLEGKQNRDNNVDNTATDKIFRVRVEDDGRGIKEEDQKTLFDKFSQVQGTYSKIGHGTGLGLSIVKEFVHLHEGEVSFSSVYGKGSEFVVTMPVIVKSPNPSHASHQQSIQ